ncbi:MAG: STAS/SEC14 domain-containing protein [Gammaproteobacteria bacterium]|nr:STAS/SEC14 domain-containing protein [Gammaproteobacteria bacterium]
MPVQFSLEDGNICAFRLTGKLELAEFQESQKQCEAVIRKTGNIRILALLDDFDGWGSGKGWADNSFAERNDQHIDKIAIVGGPEWKDLAYAFLLKGLRPVRIEYFSGSQEAQARHWLASD